MSELIINKNKENETLTVIAEGRIDTSTSPQFDTDIKRELEGVTELIIEFAKVSYISSSGLRVLLTFHKIMDGRGGKLIIKHPTEIVSEVFEVTGFADVLNIET